MRCLCNEQGLDRDMVIEAMKDAVKAAARKQFKDKTGDSIQVDWNNEEGDDRDFGRKRPLSKTSKIRSAELSLEDAHRTCR